MADSFIDFSRFHAIYGRFEDLPEQALMRLSKDLLETFKGGKEALFQNFAVNQPRTYAAIMDACSAPHILEASAMGEYLYWLGMMAGEKLILGEIYNINSLEYEEKDDLACLPEALHCYYQIFDGMNSPGTSFPGIHSYCLPKKLSSWRPLKEHAKAYKLNKKTLSKIQSDFGSGDLRVWIENNAQGLIFLDYGARDKKLYYLDLSDSEGYQIIEDPQNFVDEYCASVIRGT